MIVRYMVADPNPRSPLDDIIIYQVPEHSRAEELLVDLLCDAGIDFVKVEFPRTHQRI